MEIPSALACSRGRGSAKSTAILKAPDEGGAHRSAIFKFVAKAVLVSFDYSVFPDNSLQFMQSASARCADRRRICMYNCYVDGLAASTPYDRAMYRDDARRPAQEGYIRSTDGWAAGQVTNKQMGVISDSGGGELSGPKHNLEIYDKGETWQTK